MLIKDKNGNWIEMPLRKPKADTPEWFHDWVENDLAPFLKEMLEANGDNLKKIMDILVKTQSKDNNHS